MTNTTSSPKAPLILGGCGCVSLLAGALMLASTFFIGGAAPSLLGEPDIEMATYTNSREGRTGNLEQSYVDFSFQHPADWDVRTVDPDNINFVTVERKPDGRTWENLNVGYFTPSPIPGQNEALYAQTLGQIEGQFAQQFQDFRKVSEGPAKVAEYDAHEALYAGYLESDGQRVDSLYPRDVRPLAGRDAWRLTDDDGHQPLSRPEGTAGPRDQGPVAGGPLLLPFRRLTLPG